MNTQPAFVFVRLLVPLPVEVDGGVTRWRIELAHYGKGWCKAELVARCVSDASRGSIVLEHGRESAVLGAVRNGILAKRGTVAAALLSRLVRDGRAESVR